MSETNEDFLFKALGDPNRRRMLELLSAEPGLLVGQLAGRFQNMTRIAVMKHLKVLARAELLESRQDGRGRRLYLNSGPLESMHERWGERLGKPSRPARATGFATKLEDAPFSSNFDPAID